MAEYPSNSNKVREASLVRDAQRQEPIEANAQEADPENDGSKEKPDGIVRARKVSTVKQVFAALFPDGIAGIKEHLIWDMLVPRLQDFLHNSWDDVGDVIFSDGTGSRRRGETHVSYDRAYSQQSNTRARNIRESRAAYDYQEIVWKTREQAESLERTMKQMLRRYKVVSLLDYNEEVGYPTYPEQNHYGWISLDSAHVERAYDGWVFVMPRPVEISSR